MRAVVSDYDRGMRRNLMLFGAAFVAGLIVVVGLAAGERFIALPDVEEPADGSTDPEDAVDPSPASPEPQDLGDFTEFRDDEWGFAVSYPSDWEEVSIEDPAVRLLVTPNNQDSILVRVVTLDAPVTEEDLPQVRTLTDEIVQDGEGVEVLGEPTGVTLGGLPGIYYVYTFTDGASGQEGVHLHYFLFDGDTMITIILQALPAERLDLLAPTFQAVIESFEEVPT